MGAIGLGVVFLAIMRIHGDTTCSPSTAADRLRAASAIRVVGHETGDTPWDGVDGRLTRTGFQGSGDTRRANPDLASLDRFASWTSKEKWGYFGQEDLDKAFRASYSPDGRPALTLMRVDGQCRPIAMKFVNNSHDGQDFTLDQYA
jgi:hypothetical protein